MKDDISLPWSGGEFAAFVSRPEGSEKHPGLILIHEVWGLKDHIKDVANRFAAQGFAVLAPDLLSQTGITDKVNQSIMAEIANPATRDEAQKRLREAMVPAMQPEFGEQTIEKLETCFKYLKGADFSSGKIAVLGFYFGGTYSFALATEQKDLSGAVVFYGHAPEPIMDKIQNISCPVLAFYGEKDERLINQLPQVKSNMEKFGKSFEAMVYPNTGHAFFNDTNPVTYNKEAAQDAWQKALEFLRKNLS